MARGRGSTGTAISSVLSRCHETQVLRPSEKIIVPQREKPLLTQRDHARTLGQLSKEIEYLRAEAQYLKNWTLSSGR